MNLSSIRMLIIPVHAPAYVVHMGCDLHEWDELYPLLGCETLDSVLLQQDSRQEISLLVDDEGIARGAQPHLWARGAVIHGAAAVACYDRLSGKQTDLRDKDLKGLLELLNAKAPPDVFWPLVPFARIPKGREIEAMVISEALRAESFRRPAVSQMGRKS